MCSYTVLTIGFSEPSYTFIEGSQNSLCVTVDGTIQSTPSLNATILFSPGTTGNCVSTSKNKSFDCSPNNSQVLQSGAVPLKLQDMA